MNEDPLERAAAALAAAKCAIAVTGAGISTESGIPDFRSAHGIWAQYPPEEYAGIQNFLDDPPKIWRFWCEVGEMAKDCGPNPGHYALAELEQMDLLRAVITQNIDNLHQEAGSSRVVEYHGNAHWMRCMECGQRSPLDLDKAGGRPPWCPCGGLMKPDIVMFGEMIPPDAMAEADGFARRADVVLVVGTSAQVYPAASLPSTAKRHGAFIIEANLSETVLTRTITDAFLHGPAGTTLPELVQRVKATA